MGRFLLVIAIAVGACADDNTHPAGALATQGHACGNGLVEGPSCATGLLCCATYDCGGYPSICIKPTDDTSLFCPDTIHNCVIPDLAVPLDLGAAEMAEPVGDGGTD
jgi:hypothetical protein